MPEGHTIHRLARELAELEGQAVRASSPQGKFADGAAAVDGSVVELADAHGKHLLLHVSGGEGGSAPDGATVLVHLGMQGKFFRSTDPSRSPLKQARLRLATDAVAWDLVAPARCEVLDRRGTAALLSRLGPDPLRPDADVDAALAALAAAPGPIGAALLDQSVISGVGNVFRAEALHAVGVAPRRPAADLSTSELRRLWDVLQRMMSQAVDDGRIVTVDGPDRLDVPESESRRVYKRERCHDCGEPVVVEDVGGRTSYHCPVEQPS